MKAFKTGVVSIVGRPNVGKSTLLNQLIEQKLSIVTRKPQTTRWCLQGIKTTRDSQIIFVDTPGIQKNPKVALNRFMNKEVMNTLHYVDVLIFMIESTKWKDLDQYVLNALQNVSNKNIILAINKIDKLKDKSSLLSFINEISKKTGIDDLIPISANTGEGIKKLEKLVVDKLPVAKQLYPDDQITDKSERFFVAEFIREKLINRLGDELPYRISVTVDEFVVKERITHIHSTIWVEKNGQKSIIIGKGGKVLKSAGSSARKELEELLDTKINLKTWVKVKSKWADSDKALQQLGYNLNDY